MSTESICYLCGAKMIAPKGTRANELGREQRQGAHDACLRLQQEIMVRTGFNPNMEFAAVIQGLMELHPELETTKAVTNYKELKDKFEAELFEAFPYLKKQKIEPKKEEMDERHPNDKT